MSRRTGFSRLITEISRSSARAEREKQKQIKNAERLKKQKIRLSAQADKAAKQKYIESRVQEVDGLNSELSAQLIELAQILENGLDKNLGITFSELKISEEFQKFELPPELQKEPKATSRQEYYAKIPKPSGLERLIPGWETRYEKRLQEAEIHFQKYERKFNAFISDRNIKIANLQKNYDEEKLTFETNAQQRNNEVAELESAYKSGDPLAVSAYCTMVLEKSSYPDDFPQEFRVTYSPAPKELVVEYELPNKNIVPSVAEYKYIKSKDVVEEKTRKASEVKDKYQDIVASICLRTINELFIADQGNHLDLVVFNGLVSDIDPATGKDIRPCLVSIRTSKEKFQEINLAKVEKKACLRNLGAQVSPRPDELVAVKPVIEFDMADKRFVETSDVLSDLENRPNLMELDPYEFENLVNNLFNRIGFDTRTTQPSRDGGVDVVAFDPRPILGGKVVIQAKRYSNVVGVSAVRDLYGTMINEGANKGILVTTSHYGKDAYDFAKDKPIELIDGGGLLYLLEQNNVSARIIFSTD